MPFSGYKNDPIIDKVRRFQLLFKKAGHAKSKSIKPQMNFTIEDAFKSSYRDDII